MTDNQPCPHCGMIWDAHLPGCPAYEPPRLSPLAWLEFFVATQPICAPVRMQRRETDRISGTILDMGARNGQ